MIIIKCDKCGKEKQISSLFPLPIDNDKKILSRYTVSMRDKNINEKIRILNLCEDCEKDLNNLLDKFLNKF